jgi:hypothetical protein
MASSNDTIREIAIAKALRRHVDAATLEKVINELLDVPGKAPLSGHDNSPIPTPNSTTCLSAFQRASLGETED